MIAEIETDKATMEVEAVDEGTLGKILIPEVPRPSRSTRRSPSSWAKAKAATASLTSPTSSPCRREENRRSRACAGQTFRRGRGPKGASAARPNLPEGTEMGP